MAKVSKIDSNNTGLRYALESTIGALPANPVWKQVEPNSYDDFGAEVSSTARNPIDSSRQRKKGSITDLDASGGFQIDLTQHSSLDLLESFFFADRRERGNTRAEGVVDGSYVVDDGSAFSAGQLVFASGFALASNNGLSTVTNADSSGISTDKGLTDESNAVGNVAVVGQLFAGGELAVSLDGTRPAIVSGDFDLTTLGIIPGEWVFVGDNSNEFANSTNNGYKRVRRVTADRLEIDKSQRQMVAEDSPSNDVAIYLGTVVRNEVGENINRHTLQFERTLGKKDTNDANEQSEYLVGSVPSELTVNIPTADKLTADMSFMALDSEQRTSEQGLKAGERPKLKPEKAFNTSSDFTRLKLSRVGVAQSPEPLFAFMSDVTLTINNNLTANKAIGKLGAFDMTAGDFQVSGDITGYFCDVEAVRAVRENADMTLDFAIFNSNAGIVGDLPLISLSNGRLDVSEGEPITLPLSHDAATAASIDEDLDYTFQLVFFDYLPDSADV